MEFFMNWKTSLDALIGGGIIGLASSSLLLFAGRVFGVSGILGGLAFPAKGDALWRVGIILGLMTAGFILMITKPDAMAIVPNGPWWRYSLAGIMVGFGTQLGGGCTSGHGVCGISRFSVRSIVATVTFIAGGMLVVAVMRALGVLA